MNVIICEDERVYLTALNNSIACWQIAKGHRDVYVETYSSAEDLLEVLHKLSSCDLFFIDIEMPDGISGFQLAETIRVHNQQSTIVFVTNSKEYILKGYALNILRYITKPFTDTPIFEVLDIAYHKAMMNDGKTILLELKSQKISLPLKDILYIESVKHDLMISSTDKVHTYKIRMLLRDILKALDSDSFVQTHRGFIVNVMYIRALRRQQLTMADGVIIPISTKYLNSVRSAFSLYHIGRES